MARRKRPSSKPKRARPAASYRAVQCKDCKEEVRQVIQIEVECPLGWRDFTKHGLRSEHVKIEGVLYEMAVWRCGCGVKPPTERDARPGLLKRQEIPNPLSRPAKEKKS